MPSVTIQMSPDTLQALQNDGFSLFAFKAVQTQQGGAAPVVWLSIQDYLLTTELSWEDQYSAYVSNSQIMNGVQIMAMASYALDPGSTLEINSPGGTGTVVGNGQPGAISILNQTTTPFTTGIGQSANLGGGAEPVCAIPLYGQNLVVIAPVDTVLLVFSTQMMNSGTVVYELFSQGVLVNAGAAGGDATVEFDINDGWSWGGASWGTLIQANSNLVPVLIQN